MDKLKALKPEQKLLLSIVSLGVVAGLYYYMVIMDVDDQLSNIINQVTQGTKKKAEFKEFKGNLEVEKLKEEYAQVLKKIEDNKKVLPEDDRVPEFVHSLETDAEEAGVVIKSYKLLEKVRKDFYDAIPVKMIVTGSFMELIRFMKLLGEPGKRLVNIGDVQITVLKDNKRELGKPQAFSPFSVGSTSSKVRLEAQFIANAFTYTGVPAPKKRGR